MDIGYTLNKRNNKAAYSQMTSHIMGNGVDGCVVCNHDFKLNSN